jgi:hypothetical protein
VSKTESISFHPFLTPCYHSCHYLSTYVTMLMCCEQRTRGLREHLSHSHMSTHGSSVCWLEECFSHLLLIQGHTYSSKPSSVPSGQMLHSLLFCMCQGSPYRSEVKWPIAIFGIIVDLLQSLGQMQRKPLRAQFEGVCIWCVCVCVCVCERERGRERERERGEFQGKSSIFIQYQNKVLK